MTKSQAAKSISDTEKFVATQKKNINSKVLGDWQYTKAQLKQAENMLERAKKYFKAGEYDKIAKM